MKNIIFYLLIIFYSTPALAYLDPGSGSIIAQALIFILASVGTFFTFFKSKIKSIYSKIFKKKNNINKRT